jgi:hypothetical protein
MFISTNTMQINFTNEGPVVQLLMVGLSVLFFLLLLCGVNLINNILKLNGSEK